MIARLMLWDSIGASRDIKDFVPGRSSDFEPKAPAPGLSFALCVSTGTEPGGRPRRWSVGHLRLLTNPVQMTSPGPSRARGGSGRLDDPFTRMVDAAARRAGTTRGLG